MNFGCLGMLVGPSSLSQVLILSFASSCAAKVAGLSGRGERPSAAACAKKGSSGRMQRPPEFLPIPERGVKVSEGGVNASESSGKLLHFGKSPKKIGQCLANNQ